MSSQGLTVELDNKTFDVDDGANLLSSLLSKGADVRYGCRAGVCGACRLYDLSNCESILSCQTAVSSNMVLSTQTPATSVEFSILTLNMLDESNVEVTLLGPSDDSFGDRVFVSVLLDGLLEKEDHFVECMALNQAGAPLKIILQQGVFSKTEWQRVAELSVNDFLRVQIQSGVRKGRLLYEMDLNDSKVLLVSSFENFVFEAYWRNALQDFFNGKIECFRLSSYKKPSSESMKSLLQEDAFMSLLKVVVAESSHGTLHIIYHGQNVSEQEWDKILRPLRIRTSQLHFVR